MIRNYIRENLAKIILDKHGQPDVIAGVATGAIAIGVLVAQELGVPFIYVRPEPKKHGRKNQIEGFLDSGQNIVVVEDLISTGKSSLNAVDALKEAGARVIGMVAIFNYGFPVAEKSFKDRHLDLTTLSDYEHLIEQALDTNFISSKQVTTLKAWREDPGEWNAK
jgi:orotate phosphoribosyltransferase